MKDMEKLREILKMAFRTTTPWKENQGEEFDMGWNACLKETKKRQKEYIKNLTTFIESMNK